MDINWGVVLAAAGAAIAAIMAGIGSALGVGRAGEASAGVVSENPDLSGSCLLLQLLPGTQGIYGLLIAFVIATKAGLLGGGANVSFTQGFNLFVAALPIAFVGLISAVSQGKVAAAGIHMISKRPSESGKAMLMAVMVETYAVLALLISFLLVNGVQM